MGWKDFIVKQGCEKSAAGMNVFLNEDGLPTPTPSLRHRQVGGGADISPSGVRREYARENLRDEYKRVFGEDPYAKSRRQAGLFAAFGVPASAAIGAAVEGGAMAPVAGAIGKNVVRPAAKGLMNVVKNPVSTLKKVHNWLSGNTLRDFVASKTNSPILGNAAKTLFHAVPSAATANNLFANLAYENPYEHQPKLLLDTAPYLKFLAPSYTSLASYLAVNKGARYLGEHPEMSGKLLGAGVRALSNYSQNYAQGNLAPISIKIDDKKYTIPNGALDGFREGFRSGLGELSDDISGTADYLLGKKDDLPGRFRKIIPEDKMDILKTIYRDSGVAIPVAASNYSDLKSMSDGNLSDNIRRSLDIAGRTAPVAYLLQEDAARVRDALRGKK